jgi:hypothetical protein
MADGFAELDAQIARLRSLPHLARDSAPAVARAVEAEIVRQIGRGVGPDGKAWAPTEDGNRPLQNAAKALTVRALGTTIICRLDGPEARHHLGFVRGGKVRQILPTGKIPDPMTRAIRSVVERKFLEHMEVGRG